MVENGMIDEVRTMFNPKNKDYSKGIRKAIGVPEFDRYFREELSKSINEETRVKLLEEAIKEVKVNNCKLASQQLEKINSLINVKGWNVHRLDYNRSHVTKARKTGGGCGSGGGENMEEYGGSNSQYSPWPPVAPRPLCLSQFALVNHACQFLPYTPLPPTPPVPPVSDPSPSPEPSQELLPPPPPPPSSANIGTPIEDECCRWMRSVDSVCVCALLAHLPTFLSRPVHQYTTVPP
ncbi:Adenylate isopentenyltransferase [Datura stramonium]|uniref:Adenylate isopentenyltransferase n=1 Tax=Datura stramonium TaxID=4076 RepID=A0ABS8T9B1_DATST|nr:Adenylate isopentenyltransferase [Datura stramonium]